MERERWKIKAERCYRGTVLGKGLESRAPTEGSDIFRGGGGSGGGRRIQ